jgi:hypothetical protein
MLRLADDLKLIALNNDVLDVSRTSARLSVLQLAEGLKEHDQCASQALPFASLRLAHGKVAACGRRAASRVYGEVID